MKKKRQSTRSRDGIRSVPFSGEADAWWDEQDPEEAHRRAIAHYDALEEATIELPPFAPTREQMEG